MLPVALCAAIRVLWSSCWWPIGANSPQSLPPVLAAAAPSSSCLLLLLAWRNPRSSSSWPGPSLPLGFEPRWPSLPWPSGVSRMTLFRASPPSSSLVMETTGLPSPILIHSCLGPWPRLSSMALWMSARSWSEIGLPAPAPCGPWPRAGLASSLLSWEALPLAPVRPTEESARRMPPLMRPQILTILLP